jgi:hypothetical protein
LELATISEFELAAFWYVKSSAFRWGITNKATTKRKIVLMVSFMA